jgi:hypothetical protein
MHSDGTEPEEGNEYNDLEHWLAGQDGNGAPLWDPQVGDTLIGTFLRYESRYSKKIGGDTKIAIIEDRHRQLHAVWLSRGVLAGEYERQDPKPGDDVGHKYHGWKEPRGAGKPYHNYTVRVMPNRGPAAPLAVVPPPPQPTPSSAPATRSDDDLPF